MSRAILCLVTLFFLVSCKTPPVPPPRAVLPSTVPSIIEKARSEAEAGNLGLAWTLVKNLASGDSPSQDLLLADLQNQMEKKLAQVTEQGDSLAVHDWQSTLAALAGNGVPPFSDESSSNSNSVASPKEWLQGTATVVVNRGLKVQNGSSQPDIVIGSGFFISDDGYLLTNHHVIASEVEPNASLTSKLSLRLPGSKGERLPAKVIGWDKDLDIALLKAEYRPPYVFRWSTDEQPGPGQRLQALGSPGGLEATLTEGVVSAVNRPLLPIGNVLQIDAAVNPGNSGGPLVDGQGRVVGIVFAGIRDFQGVNFAIPSVLIRKVLPRLFAGGALQLPWMGLGIQEDLHGLEVVYVAPKGPSDWADLRVGDRLVSVAGRPVVDLSSAQESLLDFGPHGIVPVKIERDGTSIVRWLALEPRPESPLKTAASTDLAGRVLPVAFGVQVEDTGRGVDQRFRVVKVWPGSAADELSLAENDPLDLLDWSVDSKNDALISVWKVKRRLGGYMESVVQIGTELASHQFL